ncbi:hypothetical protein ACFPIJ_10770 [Dactylosporangium cerinum]|uniref:Uncharacterized protein n=1 Tax=Dactylosporangium cerinum TaxID=1434730 RepID=A0ABV9VPL1_9ACTN
MNEDAGRGGPIRDLDGWTIERLEAFAATTHGEVLNQVREIAQVHAYYDDEPRHVRLRWAKLSLRANERLPCDGPSDRTRIANNAFMLRTWVIEHLGPDADPDWDPEVLAADTLAALTTDPDDARTRSAGWHNLPIEQIRELRWHKNLTAHVERFVDILQPGPVKDRLVVWMEVRKLLP